MAMTFPRSKARPAKDEWGVYDPEQAGLAALYARLDSKDPKAAAPTAAARLIAKVAAAPAAAAPAAPAKPARPSLSDAK